MSERKRVRLLLIKGSGGEARAGRARRDQPEEASPEATRVVIELLEEGLRRIDAFRKGRSRRLRLVPRGL